MSADSDIFTRIFDKLNAALTGFVSDTSSSVIASITPAVTQLMVLYFVIYGIAMLRGVIEEPVQDFAMRVVKVALITGIALNAGIYNGEIASFLWNTPEYMAAIIAGNEYAGDNSVNFLDTTLNGMYNLGSVFWKYNSLGPSIDLGPKLVAILIWVGGVLLTGYAAFLLALAKIGLSVALALGPIFIALTLFESTKQFFSAWLGQALNFVFVVILTALTVKLILTILNSYLPAALVAASPKAGISAALEALTIVVIGLLVLMQTAPIASALAGGVAVSTLGAGAALYNRVRHAASGAKNLATGKTLSDWRGQRRQKAINKQWAQRNPSLAGRAAGLPMAAFRKMTATPNSVRKAS